jgi:hypothetical protein
VRILAVATASLVFSGAATTSTVPAPVAEAVHGRVVGWARTGPDWFVVYLKGVGQDWCGFKGATWPMALVSMRPLPVHVASDRPIGGAMCGNALSWVRSGRFTDGRHAEVAFMLWTTPSIGAQTYIYRVGGDRFRLLASFSGDRVDIGRGIVTVSFENRGRSPHGELFDVYRFTNGRYRLVRTH